MTAPRLRQHTADGRVVHHDPARWRPGRPWLLILGYDPAWCGDGYTDDEVREWAEATLVALPEPEVTERQFSTVATFGRVTARWILDGDVQINSGVQSYRDSADARRYAAGLLAAADWCDQYSRGETP